MRTLLIIDDHESVLYTLGYVFGLRGYQIRTANSGAAGIKLAAEESIDVALVDLHMPVMDGFTVCRGLRQQAIVAGRDIPVFMMTAAHTPAAAAKASEAGAVALLKKPFDHDEFLAAVERYCDREAPLPALTPAAPFPAVGNSTASVAAA
jgi:two-component system KDP operon response regulator KdpE